MLSVAIVLGSAHDAPHVKGAADTLRSLGIPFAARVLSAHRTPGEAAAFAAGAAEAGFGVLIAAAGMSAALAGTLAAHTTLPVIGLPLAGAAFGGMDSLLSTVQMPPGIPVAAVAVGGAENAALLAAGILSLSDPALAAHLAERRKARRDAVLEADRAIRL
ncbi:MAG: 5-(carboxyamino)imidazole ribonucleotide mutase [Kiritimatiellae bacterium]|nr:5-(carboxyamino)imidazole ribonucleotide mutase [Kiritimatiellia bacterium]